MPWSRLRMCAVFWINNTISTVICKRERCNILTGGDKNEQDNIRNGMRIYTNDRQHNITAGVPFF